MIVRVEPPLGAKQGAKLMAWGLGPDWQTANPSVLISNVVNGIRRGMAFAQTGIQTKVSKLCLIISVVIALSWVMFFQGNALSWVMNALSCVCSLVGSALSCVRLSHG